ncbi:MAG: NHLP bacteriocin export ABC transporter permease/ATPase subunit [Lachnospiraceae bacterium]|nr:NHLP bacteriocin export ABC transporter permease/ATPase subunit [Lachnospiraceae bacterium]
MGWFDEQIRHRVKSDEAVFEDAFLSIAGAVMGRRMSDALNDRSRLTSDAVATVMDYYHIKMQELPEDIEDVNEILEHLLRPHGIMRRNIRLDRGWYKDAYGAMLGTRKDDGSVVALIPRRVGGYCFYDHVSGKNIRLNRRTEKMIDADAVAFYRPLPLEKVSTASLFRFILEQADARDIVGAAAAMSAATAAGLLIPRINALMFSEVLSSGNISFLIGAGIMMLCVMMSNLLFGVAGQFVCIRINTKVSLNMEAAAMMRLLSLPPDFFRNYSAGELSDRMHNVSGFATGLVSMVMSTGMSSLFSLAYLFQIMHYTPALVAPALTVLVLTFLVTTASVAVGTRINRKEMLLSSKESGICYALISGVSKIRLAGAEKRAFARWGNAYAKDAALNYNPPFLVKISDVLVTAVSLIGSFFIYYEAIRSHVSVSEYYAFNASFGAVSAAFMALSGIAVSVSMIRPALDMIRPLLDTEPEVAEDKEMITSLSGAVELNNITFRYSDDMPPVLDNLSLKIRPGQYIAIVGKTGCGKSTLMRLLLGFEMPQKGAVYYDGKDLRRVDLKSLRRKIGAVMQNGRLFSGDIYSNIVISAPWLTMEDAWAAASVAGMAADIERMPMGMFTMMSEGQGGISGGQRQRILIARAIAPKPSILMFDEATSALDNITQKQVSEALDKMNCTRIVIAHRLSTIRQCDRIVVLDKGKIAEDGTYEELIEKNGLFAELVKRQRLDEEEG